MTRTPDHVLAKLSPAHRAERERVEQAARMAELEAGFRAHVAASADPIATLQAQVAERFPDPTARMAALSDPKPGTPEHALFNAVVGKPTAFVADHPDTFTRIAP